MSAFFNLSIRWRKECPASIVADISDKLFLTFVGSHVSSVNSNDITDSLGDWQVVKGLTKEDHGHIINSTILGVNLQRVISDFQRADIFVRFERFMWETGIKNDTIAVDVVTNVALVKSSVFVLLALVLVTIS